MADKQTLYFPCPGCGARFAQVEEPTRTSTPGRPTTATSAARRWSWSP